MTEREKIRLRMIAAVLNFYEDPMLLAARDEIREILRGQENRQRLPEGSIPDWRERETEQNEQHKT